MEIKSVKELYDDIRHFVRNWVRLDRIIFQFGFGSVLLLSGRKQVHIRQGAPQRT